MKLTYQLFYRRFKSSPETVFDLPQLKKFLNDAIIEGNDVMYQGKKLMRFDTAKQSIQNNVLSYVEEILMNLFSCFGALTENDIEIPIFRGCGFAKILNIGGNYLKKGTCRFKGGLGEEEVGGIFEEVLIPKLTSIIIYTINLLITKRISNQTLPLLEIWKLLFRNQQTKDLRNALKLNFVYVYRSQMQLSSASLVRWGS